MAAPTQPTQWYVDPSINANSGTGIIGDPYGDLQYALNTLTPSTTTGDQINIKAGTSEVLSAALSLTTYGTPTYNRPLVFRGYTSTANDGGQAVINCNNFAAMSSGTWDLNTIWLDTKFDGNNQGTSIITKSVRFINCEFANATATFIASSAPHFVACYFHDCSGVRFSQGQDAVYIGCGFFDVSGEKTCTGDMLYAPGLAVGCIFYRTSALTAIDAQGTSAGSVTAARIINNTFLAAGGTKAIINSSGNWGATICGNIFEGWSTGAIDCTGSYSGRFHLIFNNAYYNNTANVRDVLAAVYTDEESLGSSPLTKTGAATWANRLTYFKPVSVGSVLGGSALSSGYSKGAVQLNSAAAGGLMRHPGMLGGLNG